MAVACGFWLEACGLWLWLVVFGFRLVVLACGLWPWLVACGCCLRLVVEASGFGCGLCRCLYLGVIMCIDSKTVWYDLHKR